jgi:large subunit ribosomal protein L17
MRHLKSGRKLKRTSSHRKALLKNLATSLFEHKKVSTTVAKAKELRPYAEHLITKAKHALQNETNNSLPSGQTIDIHNRRIVARHIGRKAVLQELFDTIAPMVADRPGGYCRIVKTGFRRGDAGQTAIIELVDWSAPQDGATSKKSKKKATTKGKKAEAETKAEPKAKKAKKVAEEKVDEIAATPVAPIVEEVAAVEETVVETAVETAVAEQETPAIEENTEEEPKA